MVAGGRRGDRFQPCREIGQILARRETAGDLAEDQQGGQGFSLGVGGDQLRENPPRLGHARGLRSAAKGVEQLQPDRGFVRRLGHLAQRSLGEFALAALDEQRRDRGAKGGLIAECGRQAGIGAQRDRLRRLERHHLERFQQVSAGGTGISEERGNGQVGVWRAEFAERPDPDAGGVKILAAGQHDAAGLVAGGAPVLSACRSLRRFEIAGDLMVTKRPVGRLDREADPNERDDNRRVEQHPVDALLPPHL